MRSSIHGTFATLLLLVPVASIPALAIFGIPQFAPVVASPLHEGQDGDRESRVGNSARAPADDIFQDVEDFPSRHEDAPLAGGRMGESVPLSSRGQSRPAPLNEQYYDEQPAALPTASPHWADDGAVGTGQKAEPGREASAFAQMTSQNPEMARRAMEAGRYKRTPSSQDPGSMPRVLPGTERPQGEIRLAADSKFDAGLPQGYQRHRDASVPGRDTRPQRTEIPADSLTWQGAVQKLNDLEIRNFRLEPGRQMNQFIFICSYTPTDSPRVSYRFEAEADEPLKAVEKVLAQIDDWQQRR